MITFSCKCCAYITTMDYYMHICARTRFKTIHSLTIHCVVLSRFSSSLLCFRFNDSSQIVQSTCCCCCCYVPFRHFLRPFYYRFSNVVRCFLFLFCSCLAHMPADRFRDFICAQTHTRFSYIPCQAAHIYIYIYYSSQFVEEAYIVSRTVF